MFHPKPRTLVLWLASLLMAAAAAGHETDQFLMPEDGAFADLGPVLNKIIVEAMADGAKQVNRIIRYEQRRDEPDQRKIASLQSPAVIARAVRRQLPTAMQMIEGLEYQLPKKSFRELYPGKHTIYKKHFEDGMHTGLHGPLDPRVLGRIWRAGTIRVYDTYLGTDKIGHFIDMGYIYYQKYTKALAAGDDKEEAIEEAVEFGTSDPLAGETAVLGKYTSGAYSNADLASNYLGFLMYRNLTETIELAGKPCPPTMRISDAGLWEIAPHVHEAGHQFFARYIDDHFNEALNPSLFDKPMRPRARKTIAKRRERLVNTWYADDRGEPRPPSWFTKKVHELATYYGRDYGHCGRFDDLVHLGNTAELSRELQAKRDD